MLLAGESSVFKESHIVGLGGSDFQNLPEVATQLVRSSKPSVVIRLVYGATTLMPFRALSYLCPPLVYLENLAETGMKLPQLQVIFADHISARLDRMDLLTVSSQAKRFALVAGDYIHEFFPRLKNKVVFLEDQPLQKGTELRKRLLESTKVLSRVITKEILESMTAKAANHGALRTYLFYGAAHTLIHDMSIPDSLVSLLSNQPPVEMEPEAIISIGGSKEEVFYRLRHVLKPHLLPEYTKTKTLQFFTRHRVPPYYMAKGGDIALDEVMKDPRKRFRKNVTPAVDYDLCYLNDVSENRGYLDDFLKRIKERRL